MLVFGKDRLGLGLFAARDHGADALKLVGDRGDAVLHGCGCGCGVHVVTGVGKGGRVGGGVRFGLGGHIGHFGRGVQGGVRRPGRGHGPCAGRGSGGDGGGLCGRGRRLCGGCRLRGELGAQHDTAFLEAGLDPAFDLALGNPGQHLCIRHGRLCAKVTVVGGKIAEILRDGLHHGEGVVKPFQRTGKRPVRDGQNLARSYHCCHLSLPCEVS